MGPDKFLQEETNFFTCAATGRLHVTDGDSVTDCGNVCRSKTCTVAQMTCKRKADSFKFLSVQKFVRTSGGPKGGVRETLPPLSYF